MIKKGYTISDIYQGGYSSLSPSYGNIFTGYRTNVSEIGAPTSIQTANQIQEVANLLNQGIIPVELQAIDPKIFDQIPKQHFKELNRKIKLAGAKISVHAPMIEPSGIDPEGRKPWTETDRKLAEEQINSVVERSMEADDKGQMPITIHSAGIPGTEFKMTPEGKKVERLIVVNQERGSLAPIEEETQHFPIMYDDNGKPIPLEKGEILSPEEQLDMINNTEWINSVSQLIHYKEEADRVLASNEPQIKHLIDDLQSGKITRETLSHFPEQYKAYGHYLNAQTYLSDAQRNANALFNRAYKYGTEEEKEKLKQFSEQFKQDLSQDKSLSGQSNAMQELILGLNQLRPKIYLPIEDFAIKHSAETFANVALNAYKRYKDKAPIISIENLQPGMAFSESEQMEKLIRESKEKFVEQAVKNGVMSEGQARSQADKMIGITLDTGHLNIARKKGFKDEDLAKEVAEIAKHVKHVHLSDNFGYYDSHLPPGMGNVPTKKMMEELEKKGFKGRKIVEAGGFVQHFKTSPFVPSLEAVGAPMFATPYMGPYWNQAFALQQGYYTGFGQVLPEINFQTFGAGFSQLPTELGGQMPGGKGSRMSGKPME